MQHRRGTLVISNMFDRPQSRMIAVVDEPGETLSRVRYLSKDLDYGFLAYTDDLTPIHRFGVMLLRQFHQYTTTQMRPSRATYADGKKREWQENHPGIWYDLDPEAERILNNASGD